MSNTDKIGKSTPSTDSRQRPIQENYIFSCKYFWLIIVAIVFICLIPWVVYLFIIYLESNINEQIGSSVYITNNNIDNAVVQIPANAFVWSLAIVSSVVICAVTFIICKILSILRDLIENEQIKHHYNH